MGPCREAVSIDSVMRERLALVRARATTFAGGSSVHGIRAVDIVTINYIAQAARKKTCSRSQENLQPTKRTNVNGKPAAPAYKTLVLWRIHRGRTNTGGMRGEGG
jgi:hypothetical protein